MIEPGHALDAAAPGFSASEVSPTEIDPTRDHQAIIAALGELGGARIGHLYGSFEKHLRAVYSILGEWKASESVQLAGLFHAAYSTHGFADALLTLEHRSWLAT